MKKIIIASALVAAAAAPAFANMSDGKMKMMVDEKMSMMDTNNDGSVSMDEHTAAMNKMFSQADLNGDKMLSREEIMDHKKKEMSKYDDAPTSNDTKTNSKKK